MTTRDGLRTSIDACKHDPAPMLAYADWLDEKWAGSRLPSKLIGKPSPTWCGWASLKLDKGWIVQDASPESHTIPTTAVPSFCRTRWPLTKEPPGTEHQRQSFLYP